MPTRADNPYYQIGDNIGKALFGDPVAKGKHAFEQAKMSLLNAQTRNQTLKAEEQQFVVDALNNIASQDFLNSFDINDPASVRAQLPTIAQQGFLTGRDTSDFFSQITAATGDDDLSRTGMIARGATPGPRFAVDSTRADQISARDANEALRQATAVANINQSGAMQRQKQQQQFDLANPDALELDFGDLEAIDGEIDTYLPAIGVDDDGDPILADIPPNLRAGIRTRAADLIRSRVPPDRAVRVALAEAQEANTDDLTFETSETQNNFDFGTGLRDQEIITQIPLIDGAEDILQAFQAGADQVIGSVGTQQAVDRNSPSNPAEDVNAEQALQQAREAIARGADPEKVRDRLLQNGIDPAGL